MKSFLLHIVLLLFLSIPPLKSQSFEVGNYFVVVNGTNVSVNSRDGNFIFEGNYEKPNVFTTDLDYDGIDELLINNAQVKDNIHYYTLYIFNTLDNFHLVDSIYSGVVEPYIFSSDEVDAPVIVTGNILFEAVNNANNIEVFLPLYCWIFNGEKLIFVNDELYDIFILEIERLLNIFEINYRSLIHDCDNSKLVQGLIAAVYANYIYAYEFSNAERFLKQYYYCDDILIFEELITELL